MQEQQISFETAKLAKEKGFNEECYLTYGKIFKEYCIFKSEYSETNSEVNKYTYSAPTQSLLQKWLREIHNIYINIYVLEDDNGLIYYDFGLKQVVNWLSDKSKKLEVFNTYEEALELGLYESLKLINI